MYLFRSERGITISTQYKVSTGCHVYIGGGNEEILLEDMLEDTQVIEETQKVENHMVLQSFYQTLRRPELIVWDMHAKHKNARNWE